MSDNVGTIMGHNGRVHFFKYRYLGPDRNRLVFGAHVRLFF